MDPSTFLWEVIGELGSDFGVPLNLLLKCLDPSTCIQTMMLLGFRWKQTVVPPRLGKNKPCLEVMGFFRGDPACYLQGTCRFSLTAALYKTAIVRHGLQAPTSWDTRPLSFWKFWGASRAEILSKGIWHVRYVQCNACISRIFSGKFDCSRLCYLIQS